jgi:hypothetical protein
LACGDSPVCVQHGLEYEDILHAIGHAITVVDLEPEADPPKVPTLGSDAAGNLVEIIWLELAGASQIVIHAMALRPVFWDLLASPGEEVQ